MAIKQPRVESTSTNAAPAFRPSSSSTPLSFSSRAEVFLTAIMDQLQLIRADLGSCLDHFFDEMCQRNTRIGYIAHHQSCLRGFAPSPSLKPTESSSDGGDNDDDDVVASFSKIDDQMTPS